MTVRSQRLERRLDGALNLTDDDVVVEISERGDVDTLDALATAVVSRWSLSALADDVQKSSLAAAHASMCPGSRIGIIEVCLRPDELTDDEIEALRSVATEIVGRPAYPLPAARWWHRLDTAGFDVVYRRDADLRLSRGAAKRIARHHRDEIGAMALVGLRRDHRPGTP